MDIKLVLKPVLKHALFLFVSLQWGTYFCASLLCSERLDVWYFMKDFQSFSVQCPDFLCNYLQSRQVYDVIHSSFKFIPLLTLSTYIYKQKGLWAI